jgi:hypothetical protein
MTAFGLISLRSVAAAVMPFSAWEGLVTFVR